MDVILLVERAIAALYGVLVLIPSIPRVPRRENAQPALRGE
jgi:hypothetical protein